MFGKIIHTFGTKSLAAVINLLIAIVLSQYLGPAGKGQQGLIITTIAIILVFSNLVGGATLVYLTPRHKVSVLFMPSYFWSILISLLAFGVLFLFPVVDRSFTFHIAILSAINSFASINSTLLIGKEKIKASNFVTLLQPLIVILTITGFFTLTSYHNIYTYILALYLSFTISWLAGLLYLRKSLLSGTHTIKAIPGVLRDLFKFGFLNQLAHIAQLMSFRLSYYFLDAYHGENYVGIYSNGIALMESIWLVSKSISLVQYARIANTDDIRYAQRITLQLVQVSLGISMVLILPLILLPTAFYTFLFGEGFEGIKPVMWALAPGVLIYNINILTGHYFSGRGKYHINIIASSAGLIVSLIALYLLIPVYAASGAGWATSISYLGTSLLIMFFFRKESVLQRKDWVLNAKDLNMFAGEIRNLLKKK